MRLIFLFQTNIINIDPMTASNMRYRDDNDDLVVTFAIVAGSEGIEIGV